MARRRGFIAEWQHQTRLAEQRQRREQNAAVRAHNQAVREAARAERQAEAARRRFERAAIARDREAERAAKAAYKAQMEAQAQARTTDYLAVYDEIDNILEATLDVDDYVDLAGLKTVANHPRFDPTSVAPMVPAPQFIAFPTEPAFTPPPEPSGLRKAFGGRTRYAKELEAAEMRWRFEHERWYHAVTVDIPAENARLQTDYETAQQKRENKVSKALRTHERECAEREKDVAEANAAIDALINGLAEGSPEAVDEYIGIVLANSAYPESFSVAHSFTFDSQLRELTLTAFVPPPSSVPAVKVVKYVASNDELRETPLSQKDQRTRYNDAVYAVALRTLHEVFEADRDERIDSISLDVATEALDPSTGHTAKIVLVLAAASRRQFTALNLGDVDKHAALIGLNAAISKNPFALIPVAAVGHSVRR